MNGLGWQAADGRKRILDHTDRCVVPGTNSDVNFSPRGRVGIVRRSAMKTNVYRIIGAVAMGALLFSLSLDDGSPRLFEQAQGVIGAPLSPVSYSGVARRTTRRTVYVTSSAASASAAKNSAAVEEAEKAAAQAEPAATQANEAAEKAQTAAAAERAGGVFPVGSTVSSLPSGCDTQTVNDRSYFVCGTDWYRPAMQEGNIVYSVVAQPS